MARISRNGSRTAASWRRGSFFLGDALDVEADFALFLHEAGRKEELLHLWALDLAGAGDWKGSDEAMCGLE